MDTVGLVLRMRGKDTSCIYEVQPRILTRPGDCTLGPTAPVGEGGQLQRVIGAALRAPISPA